MAKCRLCEKNEANQTGSHSVPYSLIKSAINYNSDRNRGKEFITKFGERSDYPIYVGRDMIPEKEEEARIRYSYQKADKRTDNPYVKDYILCIECEKKLSIIEGLFAVKIMHLLDNYPHQKIGEFEFKYEEGLLIKVYVLSLFLRLSIFNAPWDFKLASNEERAIRVLVNKCLGRSNTETIENLLAVAPELSNFFVLVLHNVKLEDQTAAPIMLAITKMPYTFIANRFIFLLYTKRSHLKAVQAYLYGISDIIKKYNYKNDLNKYFSVLLLDSESTNLINQNIISYLVDVHSDFVNSKLNYEYKKKWSKQPDKFVEEMVFELLLREGYYTSSVEPGTIEKVLEDVIFNFPPDFVNWLYSLPPDFIENSVKKSSTT